MTDRSDNNKLFKILAIDGGGIRGVYAAHLLARMEAEWSIKWVDHFDLMAGTSTGSIIAAGLACGFPAKTILALYHEHSREIFRRLPFRYFGLFASRFSNRGLSTALNTLFGDRRLGDFSVPLIIPTTDIGNGCVHVMKTAYDPRFVRDKTVLVRDAVMASCSAPTFFDPYRVKNYALADGGLWANNPALVAAIDAKRRMGASLNQLRILSMGTGNSRQFYPLKSSPSDRLFGWGFVTRWKRNRFINMLLNLQAETASNMLGLLLDKEQILRLTFESDHVLPLDDVRDVPDLQSRADRDFTHNAERIKAFLDENKEVCKC